MAATDSNENFLLFRNTLTKVERLVDVRGNLGPYTGAVTMIEEGIIYTMKLLTELDGNTSESNAIEEVERLATLKSKINLQMFQNRTSSSHFLFSEMFDNMIDSKVDFIEKDSFNRLVSGGGVEPMAALERLAEVSKKLYRPSVDNFSVAKIKEVVYTPIPMASPKNDPVIRLLFTNRLQPHAQSTRISSINIVAAPVCVSQSLHALKESSLTEYLRLLKSKRSPSATYPARGKSQRRTPSSCRARCHGFRTKTRPTRQMTMTLLKMGQRSLQLRPSCLECQNTDKEEPSRTSTIMPQQPKR